VTETSGGTAPVLRPVTASASVMLAPNPSPMTLEGTNTWLLRGSDAGNTRDTGNTGGYVVIDAGPPTESHLARVAACGPIELILLTHGHPDHSGGSARLAELTGAPVLALDRKFGEPLSAGDSFHLCGVHLEVIGTPGHSADSLSFYLPDDNAVLTGDTILGRGTTVVAWPDGQLGPYLESLKALREYGDAAVLPGHGPELPSAGRVAEDYLQHRAERLTQVAKAVADGARTPREVVEIVYVDVPEVLWGAAELSVHAQLDHLIKQTPSLADQLDLTPTPAIEMAARMAEASLVGTSEPPG
jgi:glyoxylase-like metal-dependent hydrolase (beta-lactamase superfamily II)